MVTSRLNHSGWTSYPFSVVYKYFVNTCLHDCPPGLQNASVNVSSAPQMDSVTSISGWPVLGRALPGQSGVRDQMV